MGKMDFSHFYSGFTSVSAILCWMEYSVFKQSVPKLLSLAWSNVCQRQIPTSYKKNRFCSKQKRLRFECRYPFMRPGNGFLSAVRCRMAKSRRTSWTMFSARTAKCWTLLNSVEHSWGIAHWISEKTPIPPFHFFSRTKYIHVVSFSSFFPANLA